MKKGNVEITKNTGSIAKGYRIEGSSSVWKGLYTEDDLKDLRDCIDEVLWYTHNCEKLGCRPLEDHGIQPLKEEEGECTCMGNCWRLTGYCMCPCHQEKETEKKCCPCKGDYVSEFCRGECICHHETEKETPKKLPSKVDFYSTPDIDCAVIELKEVVNGIINYLDETAKDKTVGCNECGNNIEL